MQARMLEGNSIQNQIYHPRGYVRPEKGGAMVEYKAIKNHVTMCRMLQLKDKLE